MKSHSHKQHRRGYKITKKLANLEAIKQMQKERNLCLGCEAEITSTDFEIGYCTQCKTKIRE